MIRHLCRLAWNRRRTNLLLVGELTLVFLIVALMGVGWVLFAVESMESPGFEYEEVWSVNLARHDWMREPSGEQSSDFGRTVMMVRREMEALGAVESAALAEQSPFEGMGAWNGMAAVNISKEGLETLGLRLHSGRWFEPEDEALSGDRSPVVMDRRLSRALFGDQDPLGKTIDAEQVREKFGLEDIQHDKHDYAFPGRQFPRSRCRGRLPLLREVRVLTEQGAGHPLLPHARHPSQYARVIPRRESAPEDPLAEWSRLRRGAPKQGAGRRSGGPGHALQRALPGGDA